MKNEFAGIFPVMPTPLNDDESFDEKGFKAMLDFFVNKGFHGFTILGSNGEGPYFSAEEKAEIFDAAAQCLNGKAPWIAGTGGLTTAETLEVSRHAHKTGASACLVSLPTFYNVPFENIYRHYKTLGEKSGAPIMLYNYPLCTHIKLTVQQVIQIGECDGVVGIKDTLLNLKTIKAHIDGVRQKPFYVFSGTSYLMPEVVKKGGAGVICPVPLLEPEFTVSLYAAVKNGDAGKVKSLEEKLFQTLPLFVKNASTGKGKMLKKLAHLGLAPEAAADSVHAMLKEFLRLSGIPVTAKVRSPLPQLTEEQKQRVKTLYEKLKAQPN